MSTKKPAFTLRMQSANVEKIKFIAAKNKRSLSGQIEFIVERFIEEYESNNGVINFNNEDYSTSPKSIVQNNHGGNNILTAGNNKNTFSFV